MLDQGNQSDQSVRFFIVAALFIFGVSDSSAALAPTIRLSSGYDIPVVGLGTYGAGDTEEAVKVAIDSGYRHIDTAFAYENEAVIGQAINAKIADGVIKREDIFITTKLASPFHEPDQVERAFNKSLQNLNTTYIDLYLIHAPISFRRISKDGTKVNPENIDDIDMFPSGPDALSSVDFLDTWKEMEKLVKSGRVRSIGVSNFNSEQVARVLAAAEIKPVVNQVECHPNLNQRKLLKFLADRNVVLVAYSPLGRPHAAKISLAINDPKVLEIATKHNKTPGQVVLRYTHQNGAIVIPKSKNKERIQSNIDIFDFNLSKEEMQTIHDLNTNTRLLSFDSGRGNINYPFDLEF